MSEFSCPVVRVTAVEDHYNADKLSIIYFNGFGVVSAKLDDGSHRYKKDDLVVYCPQDSIIPEWLLKQGFYKYDVSVSPKNPVTNTSPAPVSSPPSTLLNIPGASLTVDGMTYTVLETGKGLLSGQRVIVLSQSSCEVMFLRELCSLLKRQILFMLKSIISMMVKVER